MQPSHNVLKIESIESISINSTYASYFDFRLNASINFYDAKSGKLKKKVILSAKQKAYSQQDGIREVINNFINGNFDIENIMWLDEHGENGSYIDHSKIHHVDFKDMPEPFCSVFADLFDISKWDIPKFAIPEESVEKQSQH